MRHVLVLFVALVLNTVPCLAQAPAEGPAHSRTAPIDNEGNPHAAGYGPDYGVNTTDRGTVGTGSNGGARQTTDPGNRVPILPLVLLALILIGAGFAWRRSHPVGHRRYGPTVR